MNPTIKTFNNIECAYTLIGLHICNAHLVWRVTNCGDLKVALEANDVNRMEQVKNTFHDSTVQPGQ
jgi:hypothetical protein